jgi:hypothetical protein
VVGVEVRPRSVLSRPAKWIELRVVLKYQVYGVRRVILRGTTPSVVPPPIRDRPEPLLQLFWLQGQRTSNLSMDSLLVVNEARHLRGIPRIRRHARPPVLNVLGNSVDDEAFLLNALASP